MGAEGFCSCRQEGLEKDSLIVKEDATRIDQIKKHRQSKVKSLPQLTPQISLSEVIYTLDPRIQEISLNIYATKIINFFRNIIKHKLQHPLTNNNNTPNNINNAIQTKLQKKKLKIHRQL